MLPLEMSLRACARNVFTSVRNGVFSGLATAGVLQISAVTTREAGIPPQIKFRGVQISRHTQHQWVSWPANAGHPDGFCTIKRIRTRRRGVRGGYYLFRVLRVSA